MPAAGDELGRLAASEDLPGWKGGPVMLAALAGAEKAARLMPGYQVQGG